MSQNAPVSKTATDTTSNDLHAPLRPLGIKAVVAASMMLPRKATKPAF